jgi:phage tail P2-like protein
MAKDIFGLSLRDVIPSSLAGDPQIQAIIDALDPELQSVSFDTREALIYSRIDELPEDVIDLLAWQFHCDFYEPVNAPLTLEVKRGLVKTSILVHRRKGTLWAVQELCDIVFGSTTVEPWFKYGGEPYHFRVSTEATLSNDAWGKFFYALETTKSVRDWLDAIEIRREATTELFYGLSAFTNGLVTIGAVCNDLGIISDICVGMSVAIIGSMTIDASREV